MLHHKLIQSLLNRLRELEQENASLSESLESQYAAERRIERRNQQLRDDNDRLERDKREQEYKDYQREDLMNKLTRQEKMGDEWGAERTKRELKNL